MQSKDKKQSKDDSKCSELFDEIKRKAEEQNKALQKLLKAINEDYPNKLKK